jgi:Family of unknown function (DUF6152)
MSPKTHMVIALSVALMLLCANVGAHHGWSGYDSGQTLNLTGVIQAAGYEHPHAYIKLEVAGKVWLVVLAPPSRMDRRGIPRAMLAVGTTATVVGYPSRTDADEMRAERITISDKTAELR